MKFGLNAKAEKNALFGRTKPGFTAEYFCFVSVFILKTHSHSHLTHYRQHGQSVCSEGQTGVQRLVLSKNIGSITFDILERNLPSASTTYRIRFYFPA